MLTPFSHVRSVVDQDGAVILDIKNDAMFILNSTGGYIWDRLQQGKLIGEIVRDLSQDTGMDSATVERDVLAFLEHLKAKRILDQPHNLPSSPLASTRRYP
jgi:hypothetical protein